MFTFSPNFKNRLSRIIKIPTEGVVMKVDGPLEEITKMLKDITENINEIKDDLNAVKTSQLAMTRRIESLDKTLSNIRNILREKEREKELLAG
jgi:chromosome segregation ATPase